MSEKSSTARLYADIVLVSFLLGGGWWASQTLATNTKVEATNNKIQLVQAELNYSFDLHIQSLRDQVERIKKKPNKDQDDRDQIKYLRDEIERIRQRKAAAGGKS